MFMGMHSVLIWSEDVKRLVPFYRDVLGLKPQMESEGFTVFLLNGAGLAIGTHSEVQGRSRDPNRMMVNLRVDDCQAEYERLSKQGVEFSRTPTKDAIHIVATFHDPDGNVLQLLEDREGSIA
ncbi:MAG: VOC family protein [Chloroflexi bacterium]|nr:VOC family protein [Chloroflexota bacterium]